MAACFCVPAGVTVSPATGAPMIIKSKKKFITIRDEIYAKFQGLQFLNRNYHPTESMSRLKNSSIFGLILIQFFWKFFRD